jgi:ACS family D-galactonate transporter-like MFS transporter
MSTSAIPSAAAARVPRLRWGIGVLLGTGILINYFDRINISVAGPQLERAFHLGPAELGLLFSAFFWSYALLQVPGGMVLDRLGVTWVGRGSAFLWSVASAITAIAGGFGGILVARVLLGIAEAPAFPASQKATGYWFPRQERARSTAIFDSAAKFSNVIGVPIVGFAIVNLGWRWGFWITAILSFAYFVAFWVFYRDPSRHPKLSEAEREYIRAGGAVPEGVAPSGAGRMLGYLLRRRKVWGLTIGFACYGYSFALFLTWLPSYLVETMHMSVLKSAGYAAIPWIFGTLADLLIGGWLVDAWIARGADETRARKVVLVGGMLVGLAVFGAMFTTKVDWAIVWISISLAGLSASAPVGSSIVSLIAPRGGTGTIGGIVNFINNLAAIVAPIVTGFIVAASGSFAGAFLVAGVVLVVGIFSYVVVLGRIEPVPEPSIERPAATVP